ncbi:MAG TPA: hypothetical protein VFC19_49260 [Candidatus Limnocylindrales bacterium]|nr:hypothetical protein [Candidatus Limnocylindrales bacterium]
MSSLIAKNIRTWADGYDMTTDLQQVGLDLMWDVHDMTVFMPAGSGGARKRATGLEDVSAGVRGLWSAGATSIDADSFANLGVADAVLTMSSDGAEGSIAYGMRQGRFKYSMFGETGAPAPFSLNFRGTQGQTSVARGMVFKTDAVAISGTGPTGTGLQLGAVGATQYLYAWAHVLTAGTTITIQVQSSVDNTFASPTTRMTLGPITTTGGVWGTRVAGPITDTWWRLNVSAITGSFLLAGLIGIR